MDVPFNRNEFYLPKKQTHKGQNGKLLLIGGSKLFHAASLWSLKVASRIVDLVHYASVEENNKIVHEAKMQFRDGIVIPRSEVEKYIEEDDCVLIGPGMIRTTNTEISNYQYPITNLDEILDLKNEGLQTYFLAKYLLQKYPYKKWVIDAGALQMMELEWIPKDAILIPHRKEFELLKSKDKTLNAVSDIEEVKEFARKYQCLVLLKGEQDIISNGEEVIIVKGGNAGMTKGGTGDVLAGLVAALYTKNKGMLSAVAASYINKKAGDSLYKKVGFYYNSSDLTDEIPVVMNEIFLS